MVVSLDRDDGVGQEGSGLTVPPDPKTMVCLANPELSGSLSCRGGLLACLSPCLVMIMGERHTCPGPPKGIVRASTAQALGSGTGDMYWASLQLYFVANMSTWGRCQV